MTNLHNTRLSDKVAEALLQKIGVIDNEPALRGARRLRELGFTPTESSEYLETFASDEFKKVAQHSAVKEK
jgi:hypothetical protein